VRTAWSAGLALGALAIAAALVVAAASWRRRPALAFGVLWFFLWLAPTNSLLPRLDVANDRQLYLPLAGLAALVAAAAAHRPRPRVAAAALLIALALGGATWARNRVYASEEAFWRDVAAKSPHNGRAWNNLGYALALGGRDAEAEAAFTRALALDPNDVRAGVNRRLLREGALRPAPAEPTTRP
jgi:tetratricopeptide (TPR) repeat protein